MKLGALTQLSPEIKEFEIELEKRLSRLEARPIDCFLVLEEIKSFRNEILQQLIKLEQEVLKLQIVYPNGETVKFPAGTEIEADLIQLLVDSIGTTPIVIRTPNSLKARIQQGLYKFKEQILKVPVKLDQK